MYFNVQRKWDSFQTWNNPRIQNPCFNQLRAYSDLIRRINSIRSRACRSKTSTSPRHDRKAIMTTPRGGRKEKKRGKNPVTPTRGWWGDRHGRPSAALTLCLFICLLFNGPTGHPTISTAADCEGKIDGHQAPSDESRPSLELEYFRELFRLNWLEWIAARNLLIWEAEKL